MEIRRFNCYTATCKQCEHHVLARTNFLGIDIYICPHNPKEHEAIIGGECVYFRCIGDIDWLECSKCPRGEVLVKSTKN